MTIRGHIANKTRSYYLACFHFSAPKTTLVQLLCTYFACGWQEGNMKTSDEEESEERRGRGRLNHCGSKAATMRSTAWRKSVVLLTPRRDASSEACTHGSWSV